MKTEILIITQMTATECVFCNPKDSLKKYIELNNKTFYANFDSFPISPGHIQIIPKRHIDSLLDLSDGEWIDLKLALKQGVELIRKADLKKIYSEMQLNPINEKALEFYKKILSHAGLNKKPDGYNFGNNDGAAAGRTVHHLHIHIIPRYEGDVEYPRGGIRHIIPGMGNYKK